MVYIRYYFTYAIAHKNYVSGIPIQISVYSDRIVTSTELSDIVGIASVNIRMNLSKLKTQGIIERIGTDKGGYWKINIQTK